MREGMYLGAPPVAIGRSRAAAVLSSMMRGGASYSGAAGGGAPLAMPSGLQPGFPTMPAANPNTDPQIAALYPMAPALSKLNLRQRFGIGG